MKKTGLLIVLTIFLAEAGNTQHFLHTEGKYIYSAPGEEIILRGIGTGNWMLQEGYMMQSADIAPTQHEFRDLLISTIGEIRTDSFYNVWLASHFTRADVDSMKAWGFNSIRPAMHYKWFTLPIEDGPVEGEHTWLDKGFTLIDSLLEWCSANQMYVILDMHGAPGGQGQDAAISDYDDSKPSLWESQANKDKLIAIWDTLAERYANEEWMGGYDLINEPNWNMSNNTPLWELYQDITEAIRVVDTNHMIIIEGNWFANDYTGVPAPWDDNMVYSFHKYWTFNHETSLSWMEEIRDNFNVPIWLGESGENSNTWFTNLISLCESKHIGWSWWPVKKSGINNILRVLTNEDYTQLIDAWESGSAVDTSVAFAAVLQYAQNHRIENCIVQYDVIDAMIRQPHTRETLPFTNHTTAEPIFASQYDLGRNNAAYFDKDTANYHLESLPYTAWNQGWSYRNDGVDIETCEDDDENMGYNVGWTADNEWLVYSMTTDSVAAYTLKIRYASGSTGARIRFESNGIPITPNINLPSTGGWQNWSTVELESVILPAGEQKVKLIIVKEGCNINYFKFSDPVPVDEVSLTPVYAWTSPDGKTVSLFVNQPITSAPGSISPEDFTFRVNETETTIDSAEVNSLATEELLLYLTDSVYYGDILRLSYHGTSIESSSGVMDPFTDLVVQNRLPLRHALPGIIQAEDYSVNNGFTLEACEDVGGGFNTAYASPGDYLEYPVYFTFGGEYWVDYRVATTWSTAELILLSDISGSFIPLDTMRFTTTGGWQTWRTQSSHLVLEEGRYNLRLLAKQGEFNLNYIAFNEYEGLSDLYGPEDIIVFPNPSDGRIFIRLPESLHAPVYISIYSPTGELIFQEHRSVTNTHELDIAFLQPGTYLLVVRDDTRQFGPQQILKTD